MLRTVGLASVAAIGLSIGLIEWTEGCTRTPPRHWLTHWEIELRLREAEMKMLSLRANDDRCFEVVATNRYGDTLAMIVNPADGKVITTDKMPSVALPARTESRARPTALD